MGADAGREEGKTGPYKLDALDIHSVGSGDEAGLSEDGTGRELAGGRVFYELDHDPAVWLVAGGTTTSGRDGRG